MATEPIDDLLEELLERARAAASEPGPSLLLAPDVYVFRADEPVLNKRLSTPGITVAVVADRRKDIHLSDGRRFTYRPGDYLCCTRAMQYRAYIPKATNRRPYLSIGVHLRPELVAETALSLEEVGDDLEDVDAYVANLDRALLDTFLRLMRCADDPVEARLVAPLIMRELVIRLLRAELASPLRRAAQSDDGRIRKAMRFIEAHSHERLTVERVAKKVGMSSSHFAHRFREIARMSPMQYAKQERMLRARMMLLGDVRVSEVAQEIGYQSPAQFTRDFKASYGLSPGAYARRSRDL